MSLTIANNSLSQTAQNNLNKSTSSYKTSLERLSSGLKVNRGADGPAALVISEKQRAQIAGLKTAIDNSEKATALVQTAEGALTEINSLLVKVRSLAIDSANEGVNDEDALAANQAEIDNALETIDRIANNTQFGVKKLLNGEAGINGVASDDNVTFLNATQQTTAGSYAIEVTTAGSRGTLDAAAIQAGGLAADETLVINDVSIELNENMNQQQVVDRINDFTAQTGVIADAEGAGGATRLYTDSFGTESTVRVISNTAAATTSSGFANVADVNTGTNVEVTIGGNAYTGKGNVVTATGGSEKGLTISIDADADAKVTTQAVGNLGTVDVTDSSLSFQIGPNANQNAQIAINKANASSLGIGIQSNQFANLGEIKVGSAAQANDALAVVDDAIDNITNLRGGLGAFQQNTLQATANNLRVTLENTINAESVIRDTDFAEEVSEFTKQQVLQQAGASVLSSANQVPQLVLSLLG